MIKALRAIIKLTDNLEEYKARLDRVRKNNLNAGRFCEVNNHIFLFYIFFTYLFF